MYVIDELHLSSLHHTVRFAQRDNNRVLFEITHQRMIDCLQKFLSHNPQFRAAPPFSNVLFTDGFGPQYSLNYTRVKKHLIKILKEYRDMEMGKKLKKYKFVYADLFF